MIYILFIKEMSYFFEIIRPKIECATYETLSIKKLIFSYLKALLHNTVGWAIGSICVLNCLATRIFVVNSLIVICPFFLLLLFFTWSNTPLYCSSFFLGQCSLFPFLFLWSSYSAIVLSQLCFNYILKHSSWLNRE